MNFNICSVHLEKKPGPFEFGELQSNIEKKPISKKAYQITDPEKKKSQALKHFIVVILMTMLAVMFV